MTNLINKLKEATNGSKELDQMIWFLPNVDPDADMNNGEALPYTTSIDAALTLIPNWFDNYSIGKGRNMAVDDKRYWGSMELGEDVFFAATPALAICIAALKVRSND